ncbi:hypothetical protein Tco_0247537, partial [Tanacetum coccineum]
VERAITTVASLDAAQDSDNIIRTQTMVMPNVDIPQGMDTGGSPRHQETMGGTPAQTRSERVLEKPNEPPLSEGHTSGSARLGEREGCSSYGDPQTNEMSQDIRKTKEVKQLITKKEEIQIIHMLVEKKYPLIKELLKKMLNLQLEAEEDSTMEFELIKIIKSMLEE